MPNQDEDYEVWREVWRITERRDGAVFKTEFVECRWVPMGTPYGSEDSDELICSVSEANKNPDHPIGIRRKKG